MSIPGAASPLFIGAAAAAEAGYQIDRSLRFNSSDSAYLSQGTTRSPSSNSSLTISFWIKLASLTVSQSIISSIDGSFFAIFYTSSGELSVYDGSTTDGNAAKSNGVLRDPSAWYHIVYSRSHGGKGTLYINGTAQTTQTANNSSVDIFSAARNIGRRVDNGGSLCSCYLADFFCIDGQALAASDFGEYDDNNVWQPKEYSGTYGTYGFHLDFSDNSSNAALGTDSSGNNNDWTVNNLTGFLSNPDVSIANATGALPIRNTTGTYGGTVATGNRTDSQSGLQLAMPLRNGVNDESGNSYTITNTGVTFTTDHSKFYGQSAAFFDTDKVNISNASGLGAFGTGDFTVEAYVKFTDNGHHFGRVIEFGSVNNNAFVIDGTTAPFRLRYDASGSTFYGTSDTIPLGKWTHVAVVRNSGTLKFYVDGVEGGSHSSTQNLAGGSAQIGNYLGSQLDFDGYMQDLRVYSSAKYTSNFTPPNDPANGLPGEELDSLIDTPTNYTASSGNNGGNYCTFNNLDKRSTVTLSNGNLDATTSTSHWSGVKGTLGVSSGKYYFEVTYGTGGNDGQLFVGICSSDVKIDPSSYIQDDTTERAKGMLLFCDDGQYQLDTASRTSMTTQPVSGDVIGVSFDLDGNTAQFYRNGTALGSIDISSSGLASTTVVPLVVAYQSGINHTLNAGQRPFAYTPPTGYVSLCTTNLPDPTIADGSTAFDIDLYTGTGSTHERSNFSFNPDLVWIKNRSSTYEHLLFDSVRGATKYLKPNSRAYEQTNSSTLSSFDSDGFTLGGDNEVNRSSYTYVAWSWDGGTSTVSNTDGSITSSVRASASNGFSIVKYVGTQANDTVGHGLNAAPDWIIFKDINRNDEPWLVYHSSLGNSALLLLNTTGGQVTGQSGFMNSTDPTSSVFSVGNAVGQNNRSGSNFLALCWTAVEGYSAFGSYEGTGNSDGPFVFCGFKPRWVMYKNADATEGWGITDTARSVDNPADEKLEPNTSSAEAIVTNRIDVLSNGFKIRAGSAQSPNESGNTYIYAAFAEHPFKTARAR